MFTPRNLISRSFIFACIFLALTLVSLDVPNDFFMPIPIVFNLEGKKFAGGTIHAFGPKTPFQIKLPMKLTKVQIDPNNGSSMRKGR